MIRGSTQVKEWFSESWGVGMLAVMMADLEESEK